MAEDTEYRTVNFRQTDYATGCVTNEEVLAPIIARHRDHDVVELPNGATMPVRKQPAARLN